MDLVSTQLTFWETLKNIDYTLLYTLSYIALASALILFIISFFTEGKTLGTAVLIIIVVLFFEYKHTKSRLEEKMQSPALLTSAHDIYEEEIYSSESYKILKKTDREPIENKEIVNWRSQIILNARKGYSKYKEPKVQGYVANKSNKTIIGIEISAEYKNENNSRKENPFSPNKKNYVHKELITDINLNPSKKLSFEFATLGETNSYWISWVQYIDGTFDE